MNAMRELVDGYHIQSRFVVYWLKVVKKISEWFGFTLPYSVRHISLDSGSARSAGIFL